MLDAGNRIQAINRYLNGDLNSEEQTTFEEAFFVDNELFLMLLAVEASLLNTQTREPDENEANPIYLQ